MWPLEFTVRIRSTLRALCCWSMGRPLTARRPMELFIAGRTANTNPNRCVSLRNNLISHSIVLYFNSNKPIDCRIHYSFATNSVLSTLFGPLLSPARHRCDRTDGRRMRAVSSRYLLSVDVFSIFHSFLLITSVFMSAKEICTARIFRPAIHQKRLRSAGTCSAGPAARK